MLVPFGQRTGLKGARAATRALMLFAALAASAAWAGVADLRITEVDPWHQQIEVTNVNGGLFQLTSEIPIPYNFDFNNYKLMSIVPGYVFANNGIQLFSLPDMSTDAGDCWLYSDNSYDNPTSLIHGVQYGTPPAQRCNSEIAALAGKWPGKSSSAPVPPPGCTLAWNGDGNTPLDWYVCAHPTMGSPNATVQGSVMEPFHGPNAQQGFENCALGDQVNAIINWKMNGTNERFNVRFVGDVNGQTGARPGSTSKQWLRIRDTDAAGANSFSSPAVTLAVQSGYRWVFYVNQEVAPTATGVLPTLVIQNSTGTNQWTDAWGVRFKNNAVEAAVLAGGGTPAAAQLYPLSGATAAGQWVKIELKLDLASHNRVMQASVNGGTPVSLPINPAGDPLNLRITYQGGGTGNTQDMLLDDVQISAWKNAVGSWVGYE